MPTQDSQLLLAQHHLKHRAAQEDCHYAYYPRSQEEEAAIDWPCSANATYSPTQICPKMDPRWLQEERQTQSNLDEDCKEGNERTGVDLKIP